VKAKRRVVPGVSSKRTQAVRTAKPASRSSGRSTGSGPAVSALPPVSAVPAASATSGVATDLIGGRPVSLEVDLGRGLLLQNPVIAAAGSMGYGVEVADLIDLPGLGGLVTRGTTLRPRSGHPAPRTADVAAGLLNGIGLQNPGIEAVLDRYAPVWARWSLPVIVSLGGESNADFAELARRLEGVPGVAGVELNLSCANGSRNGTAFGLDEGVTASLVAAVRRATDLPLIAKLTGAAADVRAIARAAADAGADVISAINTLPALALAADRRGPALGSGYGGLSGPAIRPIGLRVVYEVAQAVAIPVIGIGGVTSIDDVLDYLAAGAAAVGVGVAALADPMLPVRLADELADACRARGLPSVAGLVGTALPGRAGPPSTRGAEYAR